MLVLSRKEGERLVIGKDVVITINRISGNRITLGIEAPREVRIVRGELKPETAPRGAMQKAFMEMEIDASQLESLAG